MWGQPAWKGFRKKFFPDNRTDWRSFANLALLATAQSVLFSINGFVDNFMVGNVYSAGMFVEGVTINAEQANELNGLAIGGLGTISQWFFVSSAIASYFIGAVGFFTAQYYGRSQHVIVKQSVAFKLQFALLIMTPVLIAIIVVPRDMTQVFSQTGPYDGALVNQQGKVNPAYINVISGNYGRLAAISWFVWCWNAVVSSSQRDAGDPKGGTIAVAFTLAVHVSLNAAFLYGLHLGVEGTAYALITSRCVNQICLAIYTKIKRLPVGVSLLLLFRLDKRLALGVARRWQYPAMGIAWAIALVMRSFLWYQYFPGDDAAKIASAATVLGIAGSVQNIFLVAIDGASPIISRYVGHSLGKGDIERARKYALWAMGFGIALSCFVSVLLCAAAAVIPQLTVVFRVNDYVLKDAMYCTLVVALVYPSWFLLTAIRTVMATGGKASTISIVDGALVWAQVGLIFGLGAAQKATGAFPSFAIPYLLFYLSDLLKLIPFIYVYKKTKWYVNMTEEAAKKARKFRFSKIVPAEKPASPVGE